MATKKKNITNGNLTPYLVLLALVASIFGAASLVDNETRLSFAELVLDPASLIGFHPLTGFVSFVGIIFLIATAAICFFSVLVLREWSSLMSKFLFAGGLFSLILGIDDLFLLHDFVLPVLGVPENIVLSAYVAAAGLFFARFFTIIRGEHFKLLLLTLGFFALSLVLDVLYTVPPNPYLGEDSAKLIGILGWNVYFTCIALFHVRRHFLDLKARKI